MISFLLILCTETSWVYGSRMGWIGGCGVNMGNILYTFCCELAFLFRFSVYSLLCIMHHFTSLFSFNLAFAKQLTNAVKHDILQSSKRGSTFSCLAITSTKIGRKGREQIWYADTFGGVAILCRSVTIHVMLTHIRSNVFITAHRLAVQRYS